MCAAVKKLQKANAGDFDSVLEPLAPNAIEGEKMNAQQRGEACLKFVLNLLDQHVPEDYYKLASA
eukprot:1140149-Alexandrium_andersonii.AAC.1